MVGSTLIGSDVTPAARPIETRRPLTPARSRRLSGAVWVSIAVFWLGLGLVALFLFRNFTVDDAFIGWRHGRNLVEHGIYAFNPTGDPVEAATSPLYGLAGAIPALLGVDTVLFFKITAVLVIGGFVATALLLRSADAATRVTLVLAALAGPVQAIHLWSGLETGLFVLLATFVGLLAVRRVEASSLGVGVAASLLVLCRQEGILYVVPILWLLYATGSDGGWRVPRSEIRLAMRRLLGAWPAWLLPLVSVLTLTLFRWLQFGQPLPNTLATKTGQQSGAGTLASRALDNADNFVPFLFAIVLVAHFVSRDVRLRYSFLVIAVALPGALVYLPSTLTMNYADRFPYQLLWPLALIGVASIRASQSMRVLVALAATVAILLPGSVAGYKGIADYYPRATSAMLPLGEALTAVDQGTGTLVMGDAGQVPFVSGWSLLDTNFLGTPPSVGVEGIVRQMKDESRVVLALYAGGPNPEQLGASQRTFADPAAANGYQMVAAIQWRPDYWYHIWVSPDLARDEQFLAALAVAQETSLNDNTDRSVRESVREWYWFT